MVDRAIRHEQPTGMGRTDPDAHGQAALLLVESLMHALIEKNVLSIEDIVAVAMSAKEVELDIADDGAEPSETANHSIDLISRIIDSLEFDRPD